MYRFKWKSSLKSFKCLNLSVPRYVDAKLTNSNEVPANITSPRPPTLHPDPNVPFPDGHHPLPPTSRAGSDELQCIKEEQERFKSARSSILSVRVSQDVLSSTGARAYLYKFDKSIRYICRQVLRVSLPLSRSS